MEKKLEDANTVPNTYWVIRNHLLCNKKNPAILSLLVGGHFI